jgi:peptide deformylase
VETTLTYVRQHGCSRDHQAAGSLAAARLKASRSDFSGKTRVMRNMLDLATCIQREIDHLNGILFIDHLSWLKRDRVIKKFVKSRKKLARIPRVEPAVLST